MAGNNGGPWGGGGSGGGGDDDDRNGNRGNGGRRPNGNGDGPQIPEIDDLVRKGQEQLRVLMGGKGGGTGGRGPGGFGGGGPKITRGTVGLAVLAAAGLWVYASLYTVRPEQQSVELLFGEYYSTGSPGLNFAPWPVVRAEVIAVTTERTVDIGTGRNQTDAGLMLTGDENVIDIDFQVVWNINDPQAFLFNLRDPEQSITAVAESAMREIVAQSELAPILNRDRGAIQDRLRELIQSTLNSYEAGVTILRVNFDRADPPQEVIDAFREVQAAEQERDRLQSQADAYANRVLAGARGESAQLLEEAEAYRARVVNEAEGEASRFVAVLGEYNLAPEVTRKRLYLETMEQVFGGLDKIIIDDNVGGGAEGGQGVIPFLPINELRRGTNSGGGTN